MSSWTAVFAQHSGELRAVLTRVLGDPSLAEDCVQDTALRVLDQPIENVRDPRAFLFQVGYNLAKDALRRRQVRQSESLDEHDGVERLTDSAPSPDALLQSRQQWAQVSAALAAMPPQRRRVLWLMRVEGMSQKEVAAELGLSPKTVENHMTLALKSLASLIKERV